ncbi:MAG: hypothetical protein ACYS5V_15110, partial [Planctomycetota bacterium]
MPRWLAVLVVMAVTAAPTAADTVYLRNGRHFVGEVTRSEGKVTIVTKLGTVTVDEAEVILVTPEDAPDSRSKPTEPVFKAEELPLSPQVEWNPAAVTFPEPRVFMAARQIELLPPDSVTDGMRAELRHWQMAAHDRKRKSGTLWLDRARRQRRRELFSARLT